MFHDKNPAENFKGKKEKLIRSQLKSSYIWTTDDTKTSPTYMRIMSFIPSWSGICSVKIWFCQWLYLMPQLNSTFDVIYKTPFYWPKKKWNKIHKLSGVYPPMDVSIKQDVVCIFCVFIYSQSSTTNIIMSMQSLYASFPVKLAEREREAERTRVKKSKLSIPYLISLNLPWKWIGSLLSFFRISLSIEFEWNFMSDKKRSNRTELNFNKVDGSDCLRIFFELRNSRIGSPVLVLLHGNRKIAWNWTFFFLLLLLALSLSIWLLINQ